MQQKIINAFVRVRQYKYSSIMMNMQKPCQRDSKFKQQTSFTVDLNRSLQIAI